MPTNKIPRKEPAGHTPSAASPSVGHGRRDRLIYPALVAICALVVAAPAFPNAFTVDDLAQIVNADRLHGLSHAVEILTNPYWPPPHVPDLYRPVLSLFLALQYSLGGGTPLVFRFFSAVLYVGASLALYRLAADLLDATIAFGVAILFALHPVHVEAVVSAVGQAETIVALLTIACVRLYLSERRAAPGKLTGRGIVTILTAYFIASFTKEHALVIPGILFVTELALVPAPTMSERIRSTALLYAGLVAVAFVVLVARTNVLAGGLAAPEVSEALQNTSVLQRALTMLAIVPQWFRLLVWPAHLRVDYRPPEFGASTGFGPVEFAGLAIVVGLLIASITVRNRMPVVSFAIWAFFIALLPVSNILPSAILLAERTLFLPSVFFMLGAGAAVARWEFWRHRAFKRVIGAVSLLLAIAATVRSISRVTAWRSQLSILSQSVLDSPRNWRVWQGYGDELLSARQIQPGLVASLHAIDLAESKWSVQNRLALQLHTMGMDSLAVVLLRESLAENPNQVVAMAALPPSLIALGRYEEAKHLADSVIRVAGAPAYMVWMRQVADSAMRNSLPAGTVRVGLKTP